MRSMVGMSVGDIIVFQPSDSIAAAMVRSSLAAAASLQTVQRYAHDRWLMTEPTGQSSVNIRSSLSSTSTSSAHSIVLLL